MKNVNNAGESPKTQHTPGPWVLDYDKGSTQDILSLKHGGICTVRRAGRHDNATFAANARLIAAAPELIDALKMCHKWLSAYRPLEANKKSDFANDAWKACNAAIAKAEGRA